MPDSNIEKLRKLLEVANDGLSKAEFEKAFRAVVEQLLKLEKKLLDKNSKAIEDLQTLFSSLSGDTDVSVQNIKKELLEKVDRIYKDQQAGMNLIRDKVRQVKSDITTANEFLLSQVRSEMPVIPEIPKPKEITSGEVLSKVNDPDAPKIDLKRIQGLEEELKRLYETRRLGGGGTSDAGVRFSLGRIVKTEVPTGLINGSNTIYTVADTIHAVLSFGINGMVIHSNEYTTSKNTITFTTALPAALSGTRFEIIYV